jgi:hypothetical protein
MMGVYVNTETSLKYLYSSDPFLTLVRALDKSIFLYTTDSLIRHPFTVVYSLFYCSHYYYYHNLFSGRH